MKILVTGAAGFIGRQLVENLSNLGHKVIEVDNLSVNPLILPSKNLIVMNVQDITADFLIDKHVDIALEKYVYLICY